MLSTLLLCTAGLLGAPEVTWKASGVFAEGSPYPVSIEIEVGKDGAGVDAWLMNAGAFTLNGKPLTERSKDSVELPAGTKMSLSFDLAPALRGAKGYNGEAFKLGFDGKYSKGKDIEVKVAKTAPKGLDFMQMPLEDLSKYQVLMETNRGVMWMEFFPENAPNHVRNFLDLSYTGFYDGVKFHRVIPGFMIQAGDNAGKVRRTLDSEFTSDPKYTHVPGILSMARVGGRPHSASSQFFVMHGANPGLDNQYSVFGKLVEGQEVVDLIATTPTTGTTPNTKQVIVSATVILTEK